MGKFSEMAKMHRLSLHETQGKYAKRFGFESPTACSLWESGQRRVPENVLKAILLEPLPQFTICDNCKGAGVILYER